MQCGFESHPGHIINSRRIVSTYRHNALMYPRSTVDLARLLSDLGVFDRENAEICDVSIRSIRHWRHGDRRNVESRNRESTPKCPRCDHRPLDEMAYSYLLGLYLGDGHIAHARKTLSRRRSLVRVSALFLHQLLGRYLATLRRITRYARSCLAAVQADHNFCGSAQRGRPAGSIRRIQVLDKAPASRLQGGCSVPRGRRQTSRYPFRVVSGGE